MDDGDLAPKITENAQAVDSQSKGNSDPNGVAFSKGENGSTHLWVAATAFPMVSATLGPVASAFSICALVEQWRVIIPPGSDINHLQSVPDPKWLIVINAIQLAIALIANLFLLLNMAKRVRFSIAQPITIGGWYISAICLIALLATASGPLQVVDVPGQLIWSQAFYYGLYAAILYFLDAVLMTITYWGATAGLYSKDFKLTPSQRTLMLQTISFLIYLLLGALLFSKIEGWSYLDGVYWADVTLFTVGYGDFSPSTTLGRALMMPYAFIGITSLGLVIGSIRSMVLDRGKVHLDARALEKQRRQLIRQLLKKEKQGLLVPIDGEALASFPELKGKRLPRTEFERRGAEFTLMRRIQAQASTRRRWTAMAVSTSTWLVLWLVGAKIFESCETLWQGWSYFDGFYFAFTGLTTIGYGDITPISPPGKAFFVFWSLLALPTMTILISNAGDTIVAFIRDATLRLGSLTILPGEIGFTKEAKLFLHHASLGLFPHPGSEPEQDPPGLFGFVHRTRRNDIENNDTDEDDSGEDLVRARHEKLRSAMEDLEREEKEIIPEDSRKRMDSTEWRRTGEPNRTRAEYHLVLIDEICKVTKHLQEDPSRKYSYAEWAWYLRLIGEDEASAETHKAPQPHPPKRRLTFRSTKRSIDMPRKSSTFNNNSSNDDNTQDPAQDEEAVASPASPVGDRPPSPVKWSWIGAKSPLMDAREEAEWILDRLEQKLKTELQYLAQKSKDDGENRPAGLRLHELRPKEGEEYEAECAEAIAEASGST